MYPEETIWQAAIYVGTLSAITFFGIGYSIGRVRGFLRGRLCIKDANKPIIPQKF